MIHARSFSQISATHATLAFAAALFLFTFVIPNFAAAVSVTTVLDADPNSAILNFAAVSNIATLNGTQTFDLAPGDYRIHTPNGDNDTGFFVNGDGSLSVGANPHGYLSISGDTVTLTGQNVVFDFDGTTGGAFLSGIGSLSSGVNNKKLLPGIWQVKTPNGPTAETVEIDGAGNFTVTNNPHGYLSASGNTLTVTGLTVTIDLDAASGSAVLSGVAQLTTGVSTFKLIPGEWWFRTPNADISDIVLLDGSGNFTEVSDVQNYITASGSSLTLTGHDMSLETTAAGGTFGLNLNGVVTLATGANPFRLIPGKYLVREISTNIQQQFFLFGDDTCDPEQLVFGSGTVDVVCGDQDPEPVTLTATADSFLRHVASDRNEGANPMLRIQAIGDNRVVSAFDASAIAAFGPITKATLVFTIAENADNWGSSGRTVDAHALNAAFTEGNGKDVGLPFSQSTRGTGSGVTWKCATDTAIQNTVQNCSPAWNGGTFGAATAAPQLHVNNQTGEVQWDVTTDVLAGASKWLVKKNNESQTGQVHYYSKEGAAAASNMLLAPRLILE
jgi:hypothetical protein